VSTWWGIIPKELLFVSKLSIVAGTSRFHGMNAKVQGMESPGSRIKGVNARGKEIVIGACNGGGGETAGPQTVKKVVARGRIISIIVVHRHVIIQGIRGVMVIVHWEISGINESTSLPVLLHLGVKHVYQVK
jgi:hypothetical protein